MDALIYAAPAQFLYAMIPAKQLRSFTDATFASFAVNPIADSVRGMGHRYMAGHDLLLDIPKTVWNHGIGEGLHHAGHVILTDFPTKAGIPIPGFSHSGLGHILEEWGIHRGWLQLNLTDAGVGILAIAEGASDLAAALQGSLQMDWGVFFDTTIEGSLEIVMGVAFQNPFLVLGGVQNVLAGLVATYNQISVYVDPLDFFGSAITSAIIGFVVARGLVGENISESAKDSIRSGIVGAFFSISPAFGFGAIAGFASYRIGASLGHSHNKSLNGTLSLNREGFELLVSEICDGNIPVQSLLTRALVYEVFESVHEKLNSDAVFFNSESPMISLEVRRLDCSPTLLINSHQVLDTRGRTIGVNYPSLVEDVEFLEALLNKSKFDPLSSIE